MLLKRTLLKLSHCFHRLAFITVHPVSIVSPGWQNTDTLPYLKEYENGWTLRLFINTMCILTHVCSLKMLENEMLQHGYSGLWLSMHPPKYHCIVLMWLISSFIFINTISTKCNRMLHLDRSRNENCYFWDRYVFCFFGDCWFSHSYTTVNRYWPNQNDSDLHKVMCLKFTDLVFHS